MKYVVNGKLRGGWFDKLVSHLFVITLSSPDGNSRRFLTFHIRWNKYSYHNLIKLNVTNWSRGERQRLERWFSDHGVYPEW